MESEKLNTTQDAVTPTTGEQTTVAETKPVEAQVTDEKPTEQTTTDAAPAEQSAVAAEEEPSVLSTTAVEEAASTTDASAPAAAPEEESKPAVEEVEMTEASNDESAKTEKDSTAEQSALSVEANATATDLNKSSKVDEVKEAEETAKPETEAEQMDTTSAEAEKPTTERLDTSAAAPSVAAAAVPEAPVADSAVDTTKSESLETKLASVLSEEKTATENNVQPAKKQKIDYANMAVRQYLDHTVVPILLAGLASVAKSRPDDPITYLANYLTENKAQYDNNQENSSLNGNQ